MDTQPILEHEIEYELIFKNERRKDKGRIRELTPTYLGIGRHIIGRASSCDFQIKSRKVSAIHAVIEITPDNIMIFDMNSTNGLYVNSEKSIVSEIKEGDSIAFAGYEYILKRRAKVSEVLDKKETKQSEDSTSKQELALPILPSKPLVGHPLSLMPDVEQTEYIFENAEEVYPIFKYDLQAQSLEVLIIHDDNILSIDYLDLDSKEINFIGKEPKIDEPHIFFPYLKKKEKALLLENESKRSTLHALEGFRFEKLDHRGIVEIKEESILLAKDDIIRFSSGSLEIYIRKARKPPIVAAAPIMRRDAFFHTYVIPTILALLIPLIIVSFLNIEVEDKSEENIQRLATILYNKQIIGDKPATSPKTNRGVVSTSQEKNPENKKGETAKGTKIQTPTKQSQVAKKPEPVKKTAQKPQPTSKPKKTVKRTTPTKNKKTAKVKGFKNLDFSSSLNQLVVSQQRLKNTASGDQTGDIDTEELSFEEGGQKRLKRIGADGSDSLYEGIGDRITQDVGAEGLSDKTSLYRIGIPGNAVVKGAANGYDIARKLRQHLKQFQFCVMQNTVPGRLKTDRVTLKFIIGASGYVTKGVAISKVYDRKTTDCMGNVLKGIAFTPPVGGGNIDVDVPLNIQSR